MAERLEWCTVGKTDRKVKGERRWSAWASAIATIRLPDGTEFKSEWHEERLPAKYTDDQLSDAQDRCCDAATDEVERLTRAGGQS